MAAMADSFSNTSWSIVRGAERSARAAADPQGPVPHKRRHEPVLGQFELWRG
jgi:hypothetical protein